MTDDTGLRPLPAAEWDASLNSIVDAMGGRPLAVHGLLANHPALLKAWWDIRNYTIAGGDLGQRNAELVILRVARQMKNWYEWGSHVQRGMAAGLTEADIEGIKSGPQDPRWSDADSVLLQAVDELVADHGISGQTMSALKKHFSGQQILDVIVTHGAYVILGCMLNSWDVELDGHVEADLPEGTSRELFEKEFRRD
jgi:4-carboxymuconolactone decarboxylase